MTDSTIAFTVECMAFCWNHEDGSISKLFSCSFIAEEFVAYTALPVFYVTSLCTCSCFCFMMSEFVWFKHIILIYLHNRIAERAFVCGIAVLCASWFYGFDYFTKGIRVIGILVRTGIEFEFKLAYLQYACTMNSRDFPFKILIRGRTFAGEVVRSIVLILEHLVIAYLIDKLPSVIAACIVTIELP